MRISDVLRVKGTQVVTVTPDTKVRQLLAVLAEHSIGAVVVSHDGVSVDGIVSERDIVWALARRGAAVLSDAVTTIYTAEVYTVTPETSLEEVGRMMTERRVRHAPVVVDGGLRGIVSIGDMVKNRIGELETEQGAGVQIRIYLAIGDDPGPIDLAILDLLDAYGFRVEFRDVPVMGSWFREFWVHVKRSSPPIDEQLIKLARAVELQGLDRPQSEVDLNQAEAVARLLGALDSESDALIQIGSVFLVKFNNVVIVRNLSQTELAYFNRNPALFKDPEKALQCLQQGWPERQPPSIAAGG